MKRLRGSGDDRGAVSLEYLVVGAALIALVGALLTSGAAGRSAAYAMESLFCKAASVVGAGCTPESPRNEDYKPVCEVSNVQYSQKNEVKVAFVKLGDNMDMTTSYNSDGSVDVTLLAQGGAGVEAKVGAKGKLKIGDLNIAPEAMATASAELNGQSAQTWSFDNADEAKSFADDLKSRYAGNVLSTFSPVAWAVTKIAGAFEDDLPPPTTTTVGFGGKAQAGAEASANILGQAKVEAGIGGVLSVSKIRVQGADGKTHYDTETAMQVDLSGTLSGNIFGAGAGGEKTGSGVVKIRRNDKGEPLSVTWVGTAKGNFKATFSQPDGLKDALDLKKAFSASVDGGAESGVVVTTSIDLNSPERRAAFQQWYDSVGKAGVAGSSAVIALDSLFSDGKTNPAMDTAFGDLVQRQAKTSFTTFDSDIFGLALGAEGDIGIGLGFEVGGERDEANTTSASYLGAPDAAGDRPVLALPECVSGG